ncbi:hypothetical protein DFH11DRAFT_1620114 [Phellopilus nigrolimitatus]|nr:hypothetical protein DFH11DRAFT_1620114 [Phellopilus nigrolimitatus]
MPLHILATLLPKYYPSQYQVQIGLLVIAIVAIRTYAQGRSTNRERDLHGRVILLTGSFTSIGSLLMEALSRRGAHIIALSHLPVDSPQVTLIVEALRETTKNESIFAEQCDFLSIESVRAFCTNFLTGKEHRLDAIIFAHEYEHTGPLLATNAEKLTCEEKRAAYSDATFLMTTLLLPTLLVAPAERDIRIINVVNPFYAAAVPLFPKPPPVEGSQFVREGYRALRTMVFTRHLQRVFDALPQAPAPNPDTASAAAASSKAQKSNIVAVTVSPGFSRHDTIAPLLRANRTSPEFSILGLLIYILLQPFHRILTKTPSQTIQSVLHVLFLPTPFKSVTMPVSDSSGKNPDDDLLPEEVLKPGALYSNCSIVRVDLQNRVPIPDGSDEKHGGSTNPETKVSDDGEYGGETLGRLVWESFEEALKSREKAVAAEAGTAPSDKKCD